MNDIHYSNEVDSLETLPLLRPEAYYGFGYVHKVSSVSEVGLVYLRHALPHSIIRGVII